MKEEITYIAKRYRRDRFSVDKAWRRLNIKSTSIWPRLRITAAITSIVVLTATAAVLYHQYELKTDIKASLPEKTGQVAKLKVVKVIDFENTPLPTVILKINEVYGVEVVNIPDNAVEYHLSLHYEGNAVDLIATINDILETQMTVEE